MDSSLKGRGIRSHLRYSGPRVGASVSLLRFVRPAPAAPPCRHARERDMRRADPRRTHEELPCTENSLPASKPATPVLAPATTAPPSACTTATLLRWFDASRSTSIAPRCVVSPLHTWPATVSRPPPCVDSARMSAKRAPRNAPSTRMPTAKPARRLARSVPTRADAWPKAAPRWRDRRAPSDQPRARRRRPGAPVRLEAFRRRATTRFACRSVSSEVHSDRLLRA